MADSIDMVHLSERYGNAYKIAEANVQSGEWMKSLGVLFGVLIALPFLLFGGMMGGDKNLLLSLVVGGVLGLIVGVVLNRIGTVIAAHGEMLRAVLDVAVNTSPFLDEGGRAQLIARPRKTTVAGAVYSELG